MASGGRPVSFHVVRGRALIVGSTIVATNVGTVEVVAEQAGNAEFDAVSDSRLFNRSSVLATPLPVPAWSRCAQCSRETHSSFALRSSGRSRLRNLQRSVANPTQ